MFAVAWRRGEVPRNARAWLLSIARRVLANQVRSARRRTALQERVLHQPAPLAPDGTRLLDELDLLTRALRRLRPGDREVVELLAAAELSTAELARVLGCSTPTAATRVYRARRRLRTAYRAVTDDQEA